MFLVKCEGLFYGVEVKLCWRPAKIMIQVSRRIVAVVVDKVHCVSKCILVAMLLLCKIAASL